MNQSQKNLSSSTVQLTNKQANIYAWGWQDEARFRDAVCGRRFGKTFLGAKEMRRAAKLAVKWDVSPDDEIWYAAPTFKQAKRVFWRRLKRSIPKSWMDGKPNETECYIALKSGHMMRVVGLDSYDNLRGSGLFFCLIDEWADCPYEAFEEVIRPMLSTCKYYPDENTTKIGGHVLRIGTPKGFNHCFVTYMKGQDATEADHKSWLYTTLDGGNVPQPEIDAAMRDMDPRTFRQEYQASFENYSGRVYYGFDRRENVKPCPLDKAKPLHVGMDFNINPMSATIWQEDVDGRTIYQIDEVVLETSNTNEMADELLKRYANYTGTYNPSLLTIYPDPAGAQRKTSAGGVTDISILRSCGFSIEDLTSHTLVRDRINTVCAKIQNAVGERNMFVDPKCKKSIKCYEQLTYKEGTDEPDKKSGFDHLPDASGYYIYTRFGKSRTKIQEFAA